MKTSSLQRIVPILAMPQKRVIGIYRLGANRAFDGTETTLSLTSPAGVVVNLPLIKHTPELAESRGQNRWFMAVAPSHEDVRIESYKGFTEFEPVSANAPFSYWSVSTGVGPQKFDTKGDIVNGLENAMMIPMTVADESKLS